MSMPASFPQKNGNEYCKNQLSEDFRCLERNPAQYFFSLEGLILPREDTFDLLEHLFLSRHPLIHLYMPNKHGEEETHEFKVQQLGNNTLSLLDLSRDETAVSFMKKHSTVRFGFEHQNTSYIFETSVLGFVQDQESILLADMPERIYRERRQYPRYQLWPDHKAYLEEMQVHDISWSGLRVLSERSLRSGDTLKNVQLTLPLITHPQTEAVLYAGSRIQVPRIDVRYRLTQDICSYYGLYFEEEWVLEQSQELGDFLLAVRKHFFYRSGSW